MALVGLISDKLFHYFLFILSAYFSLLVGNRKKIAIGYEK